MFCAFHLREDGIIEMAKKYRCEKPKKIQLRNEMMFS